MRSSQMMPQQKHCVAVVVEPNEWDKWHLIPIHLISGVKDDHANK
jgi:hypothetical protein